MSVLNHQVGGAKKCGTVALLPAEVIADNRATVTGIADTYGNLPPGSRALTITNNLIEAPLLDILGRCDRTQPCATHASLGSQLAQTLHLDSEVYLMIRRVGGKKRGFVALAEL